MTLADLPTNQITGAIVLAIAAAVLKYVYDRYLAERKDQLDRLNRQLELLYGPLLALSYASNQAWSGFCSLYGPEPGRTWFDPAVPVTELRLTAWRLWIREVFMPINERIEGVILEHFDLLEDSTVPDCILELISHVEGYRGVLKEWEAGKFDQNTSFNNFPSDLEDYAQQSFSKLKERQMRLLRQKTR